MIDRIIVNSLWGPVHERHWKRLAQVSYHRFSQAKTKQTTTYMQSPLTGAQIEVTYIIKEVAGSKLGHVEISIPVASALIGHNCFHAGLEVLHWELQCLELLLKIVLLSIGMVEHEIQRYLEHALIMMVECTWDTQTASPKARRALQLRTHAHAMTMRALSSRHDIGVEDADPRNTKSGISLLVTLKAGDFFRQYCKPELVRSKRRSRKTNSDQYVSDTMKSAISPYLDMLESHARNELLVGADTLKTAGIRYLRDMTPEALERAMVTVWRALGFRRRADFDVSALEGSSALDTLNRYEAGEDVTATLPEYRVSRDRLAILEAHGPDIADQEGKKLRFKAANLGRQSQYPRRWLLLDEMRNLVVSERTGPAILNELRQGLEFVADSVVPEFDDEAIKQAWLSRWMKFAKNEQIATLPDTQFGK